MLFCIVLYAELGKGRSIHGSGRVTFSFSKCIYFYRAMIRRGYDTVCRLSVCPSATFRYRDHILEYFENNFTADCLRSTLEQTPTLVI